MAAQIQNASYRPLDSSKNFRIPRKQLPTSFNIESDHDPAKLHSDRRNGGTFQRVVTQLWILEWSAWIVALLAMAGIVGVLAAFNGRPIPEWPYGITLGALVSLLATIANVGLAGPISAGLGQAKWLWFARERNMADFELIDEASRGPYKSTILLMRGKGGMIAIFGAVLTIITLAVGPFVQQVVQYDNKPVRSNAAAVPIATQYSTFGAVGGVLETDVPLDMKAAIQRGLLDINANASTFFVSPQCPTGNCTWNPYTTLGICAQCTDLSSQLTVSTDNNTQAVTTSLSNNVTLVSYSYTTSQGFIAMVVNSTYNVVNDPITSIAYADWGSPLVDVFTIIAQYGQQTSSGTTSFGPYASECILQFCTQDHSSSVRNGTFTEQNLNTPQYFNYSASSAFNMTVNGTEYSVDFEDYNGLSGYFGGLFNTEVHQSNGLSPTSQWPDDISQSIFYWTNSSQGKAPIQMFSNIASSMSLNIRSNSDLSSPGTATYLESVVSVHWLWMILPFALLAFVLVYLVVVVGVSKQRGQKPWKTSSVALLMHGLMDDESRSLVAGIERLDEMQYVAGGLRMKLVNSAGGEQEDGNVKDHIGLVAR